ncbi:hypothetical protein MMC22_009970, partial [Lobaria immixta]|nr:hypothetical protein [Lobaria immixta]
ALPPSQRSRRSPARPRHAHVSHGRRRIPSLQQRSKHRSLPHRRRRPPRPNPQSPRRRRRTLQSRHLVPDARSLSLSRQRRLHTREAEAFREARLHKRIWVM